jgi:hypothetical protein
VPVPAPVSDRPARALHCLPPHKRRPRAAHFARAAKRSCGRRSARRLAWGFRLRRRRRLREGRPVEVRRRGVAWVSLQTTRWACRHCVRGACASSWPSLCRLLGKRWCSSGQGQQRTTSASQARTAKGQWTYATASSGVWHRASPWRTEACPSAISVSAGQARAAAGRISRAVCPGPTKGMAVYALAKLRPPVRRAVPSDGQRTHYSWCC